MNSHTPDGVAKALRAHLDAIDQVIADNVTDDDIETRLRRLTEQARPSASASVDRSNPVPRTGEHLRRSQSHEHGSPADVVPLLERPATPSKRRWRNTYASSDDTESLATVSGQLASDGLQDKLAAMVETLYRQFGGALFGHVLYLTGNDRQWAEDVVHETFLRAMTNAERLDREPAMIRAWLYTVARRIVIDGRRSHSVRPGEVNVAPLEATPMLDTPETRTS